MGAQNWTVAEAKAKLSEIIDRANVGGSANHHPEGTHSRGCGGSSGVAAKNHARR